jgi:site-specific recombinase XerD
MESLLALEKDEFLKLLEVAKREDEQTWLMMLVHFWHGLRNSEVRAITRDNIHNGRLVLQRLKGSEDCDQELVEDENPLLSERQALTELALNTTPGRPLFKMCRQTYWRHVRAHALAAGIHEKKAKTTVLKHTLATLMIENTPINNVQRRLGHVSLASTGKYMKVKERAVDGVVKAAVGL